MPIILLAILMTALNAFWLLLTLLMLPGNWLMVVTAALVAWWRWDDHMFSPWTLAAAAGLAMLGELVELLTSAVIVKQAGGSRRGALGALGGAIVGGVVGTVIIPIPLIGSLVGLCGGACLGAWATELTSGRGHQASVRSGLAAGKGQLLATLGKFAIGVVIWVLLAVAAFWP